MVLSREMASCSATAETCTVLRVTISLRSAFRLLVMASAATISVSSSIVNVNSTERPKIERVQMWMRARHDNMFIPIPP